ncbi:MAG: peptidase domain-containing ABC transporter [Aquisalinus sp.]|nr:peptidase domain-containing ABC transporter [Aquisalinus sp.]
MSEVKSDSRIIDLLNFTGKNKIPVILQSEATECGLACLTMVASYHGYRRDLSSMRRDFNVSIKGATLQQLMTIGSAIGFATRPVRLEMEDLKQLQVPCILHWDLCHFVVLVKVDGKTMTIHDPAKGQRKVNRDDFAKHFTGVALELTPTKEFQKREEVERVRLWDFWDRITGLKRSLIQLFLLAALMQAFALASPFYSQLVIDEVITKGDINLLNVLIIGFAVLMVIETTVGVVRSYVGMYLSKMMSFQMQTNLFNHLLKLPVSYFEKRHIGDITSRFGSLGPVQALITGTVISVVLDGIMAISTLAMMLFYSGKLTALVLLTVTLTLVGRLIVFPYVRKKTEENIHLSAMLQSNFLETIRGARTIKIFGQEQDRMAKWQNAYADVVNNSIQLERFTINTGIGTAIIFGSLRLLILYVGAMMVIGGEFTLGMLIAFQSYQGQFTGRAQGLISQIIAWRMIGLHLERLADVVHTDKEEGLGLTSANRDLQGSITIRNVSFSYAENEPLILKNVDLTIAAGESVAIMGASGAGKTTLLRLMLSLLEPKDGEILVDDLPLTQFGRANFRKQIGVVMQDDDLFSGTLAENIAFFEPEMDIARVEEAARKASVHDDITRMPMGYQSLVGDMGSSLSGGQKQRVLLARALYRDPKMLFLDEGTANLDGETEKVIANTLKEMKITKVYVAHRKNLIMSCDRVLVVEDSNVDEQSKSVS